MYCIVGGIILFIGIWCFAAHDGNIYGLLAGFVFTVLSLVVFICGKIATEAEKTRDHLTKLFDSIRKKQKD